MTRPALIPTLSMTPGERRRRAWMLSIPDPDPLKPALAKPPADPVVYFFQTGESVKIGKSTDWRGRMAALQTGSPDPITPLLVLRGSRTLERQLHIRFKDSHIRGEWFRCSDALMAFIAENAPNSVANLVGDTDP